MADGSTRIAPETGAKAFAARGSHFFVNALMAAYTRNPELDITYGQLTEARTELPEIWQECSYIEALIKTIPEHPCAARIPEASLLLHARAYGITRKFNSDEPASMHSFRVTNRTLGRVKEAIIDKDELVDGTVAGLLHDGDEDFGISIGKIKSLFGARVAESVDHMTTPKIEVLAELYKDKITRQFIPPSQIDSVPVADSLHKLERWDRNSYETLKSRVKLRFKLSHVTAYNLFESVHRGEDNLDSILSYNDDIAAGRIYVHPSHRLGPPPKQRMPPRPLSTAEARRNIEDRTIYHDAIVQHIEELGHPDVAACLDKDFRREKDRLSHHIAEGSFTRSLGTEAHIVGLRLVSWVGSALDPKKVVSAFDPKKLAMAVRTMPLL